MNFPNEEPLARNEDESTSHEAAEKLTNSGRRDSLKTQVYLGMLDRKLTTCRDAVTTHELSVKSGIDHPTCHKRLPDLRRDGYVTTCGKRECSVTHLNAMTWRALTPEERAAQQADRTPVVGEPEEPEQGDLFLTK